MSNGKVGIALTPARFDHNGFGSFVARNYAAAFRRLGFEPVFVALGEQPVAALDAPDIAFVFSHSGWVLAEPGYCARKPVVVLVADPTFSWWVAANLARLPPHAAVFYIDPGFLHGIGHWLGERAHAAYLPCVYASDGPPHRPREKSIEVLFVGSLRNPTGVIDDIAPRFRRIVGDLVDVVLFNPYEAFTALARPVFAAHGEDLSLDNVRHRQLLNVVDQFVRFKRREIVVWQLLDHPVTFVTDNLVHQALRHPAARVLPPQDLPRTIELLRRSKSTVVCQPNFSHAVNERIVFAMQSHCGVIATPNARLPNVFGGQRSLVTLAPRLDDVGACLERARASTDDQALDAAYDLVTRRHTADANARMFIATLAGRGLIQAS